MGAAGDDGDGEEAGIRSDQNEEGVGRWFLQGFEKGVGRVEVEAVGVEDDAGFDRSGLEAG